MKAIKHTATAVKDRFNIRYCDNAACLTRGGCFDTIDEQEFEGTLNEVLNFGAWAMTRATAPDGYLPEDRFRAAVKHGLKMQSDEDAIDTMDSADLGAGSPVIFWIEDSRGNRVYKGVDEEDFKLKDDDDEDDEGDEDWDDGYEDGEAEEDWDDTF